MKYDLTERPEGNDPLDAWLREADEYVLDDGFSSRVVAAVPKRRRNSWTRLVLLSGAILLGAGLAIWSLPPIGELLAVIPKSWTAVRWETLTALLPMLVALVALGWGVFALVNEEE